MYSLLGDTVLDPFLGTGTTVKAAMVFGRNSIGYELLPEMTESSMDDIIESAAEYPDVNISRLRRHMEFVRGRISSGKEIKHTNDVYGIPVVTAQEKDIQFYGVEGIRKGKDEITVSYRPITKGDDFN